MKEFKHLLKVVNTYISLGKLIEVKEIGKFLSENHRLTPAEKIYISRKITAFETDLLNNILRSKYKPYKMPYAIQYKLFYLRYIGRQVTQMENVATVEQEMHHMMIHIQNKLAFAYQTDIYSLLIYAVAKSAQRKAHLVRNDKMC